MTAPLIERRQVRHRFSEHAGEYDIYARVQKRVAARLLELAAGHHFSGPALDIGTGTGEAAGRFLEKYPCEEVVVSDIAHAMTRTALGNLPGTLAVDADARTLPFADRSFGLALSSSVFQWVEDLSAVFAECHRVLRPGGYFCFAMFCDGTLQELEDVFQQALVNCESDWPFHFQVFPARSGVEAAMQQAGFRNSRLRVETECEYHENLRSLMNGLKRIGAQNASRSRPGGLFPRRVMREMDRLYRQRFMTGEGLPASYGVLYGLAMKDG